MHYGVKGMKWGVRRYQNYDGTYTQRGLKRYNKAVEEFNSAEQSRKQAKQRLKTDKSQEAKNSYRKAKTQAKAKQKTANKAYDNLKKDRMADEGKKLYQQGKTISGNTTMTRLKQLGVGVGGSAVASAVASTYGNTKYGQLSAQAIATGSAAVAIILGAKATSENRKLRAYYAH